MTCGPTRNLTSIYLKFRAEHKRKRNRFGTSILGPSQDEASPSGKQRLLTEDDSTAVSIEMVSELPPVWVDLVEEAQEDMARIKENMATLQKAEQKRLLKIFHEDDGMSRPDQEIGALTLKTTQLFKACEHKIQRIQGASESHMTNAEYTLRRNAQKGIAMQLQSLSQQFRRQQKNFMEGLRRRGGVTEEPKNSAGFDDGGFNEALMTELGTFEQNVDNRNEEIARIAESVAELHQIFKDLAMLVIDQGTILDRIDYNIEQVVTSSKQANVHITKAEEHQKSKRAAAVVGCLVISVIALLIIFIVKHLF